MLAAKGDYSSKAVAIPKTLLVIFTMHLHYLRNSVYETAWTTDLKDFEHYISSFPIDIGRFSLNPFGYN
jgi:uncharacterized membrane protein